MRSTEPGISRFRIWSFGPSRNDEGENEHAVTAQRAPSPHLLPASSDGRKTQSSKGSRHQDAGCTGRSHVSSTDRSRDRQPIRWPRRTLAPEDARRSAA
nr:hypothetical protein CIT39_30245 [Bradyrhizobium symbiodeficiens]